MTKEAFTVLTAITAIIAARDVVDGATIMEQRQGIMAAEAGDGLVVTVAEEAAVTVEEVEEGEMVVVVEEDVKLGDGRVGITW